MIKKVEQSLPGKLQLNKHKDLFQRFCERILRKSAETDQDGGRRFISRQINNTDAAVLVRAFFKLVCIIGIKYMH